MESLHSKTLVMIVGPTAIGKSTLMHEVTKLDDRFGYVGSFTTRDKRTGDTSTYRHISEQEAKSLYELGKTVTYFEHPTTHVMYGTTIDSYTHSYNLLDTLSGTVEQYRTLPFKRTIVISLTADPEAWSQWLGQRFPDPSVDRTRRLNEALSSIEWSLGQTENHNWVVNTQDDLTQAARNVIDIVTKNDAHTLSPPPEANKLLKRVKSLL